MIDGLKKILKRRQFYLRIIVTGVVLAMVLKLYNLQIVNGNVLNYLATRGSYAQLSIEAPRGKIYDRNGRLIAYNRTGYNVQIVRNTEVTGKDRDRMYYNLLKIFEKNGDEIENTLKRYITPEFTFGVLINETDDADKMELKEKWIKGMISDYQDMLEKGEKAEQRLNKLMNSTAREIFDYFRKQFYEIDESYSDKDAYNIMVIRYNIVKNGGLVGTTPHLIATDVSEDSMSEIETRHLEFPGVSTVEVYFRQYNDSQVLSHVLGYVKGMGEEEYKNEYEDMLKRYITPEFTFGALIDETDNADKMEIKEKWLQGMINDYQSSLEKGVTAEQKLNQLMNSTAREIFDYFRKQFYKIDESYSDKNAYNIMVTRYNKEKGYSANDIIGKDGIEKAMEEYLRGTKGSKTVYVDKNGRELEEVDRTDAIAGDDIYLTIDLDLQKVARESMEKQVELIKQDNDPKNLKDCVGGAVVAMDVKTGEILASVSYPDYDPGLFLAPSSDQAAQKAISALYEIEPGVPNPESPSVNRATKGLYAPGSIYKPIIAVAGLETEKIVKGTTIHNCEQTKKYANFPLTCLSKHGSLNIIEAMVHSCNIFFYDAGVDIGIETIDKYTQMFGLGEKTGIELPELQGKRSNEATMAIKEDDLTHRWSEADTAQTSIGQLYCQFTPVQLARYAAALGTRGNLMNAHIVQKKVSEGGKVTETKPEWETIEGISGDTYDTVNDGMEGVIENSSSIKKYFKDFPFKIAGKTGTPEVTKDKSSNGTFICYAPANDPQIAVVVVLEQGVWGYNAAPIASDILKQYFRIDAPDPEEYSVDNGRASILP